MRLLHSLGLADVLAESMIPVHDYEWFGGDGELLLRLAVSELAPSGWDSDYMFVQPELEASIHRYACIPSGVTLERGLVAQGLEDLGDHVELTLHGCDQRPAQLLDSRFGVSDRLAPQPFTVRVGDEHVVRALAQSIPARTPASGIDPPRS